MRWSFEWVNVTYFPNLFHSQFFLSYHDFGEPHEVSEINKALLKKGISIIYPINKTNIHMLYSEIGGLFFNKTIKNMCLFKKALLKIYIIFKGKCTLNLPPISQHTQYFPPFILNIT